MCPEEVNGGRRDNVFSTWAPGPSPSRTVTSWTARILVEPDRFVSPHEQIVSPSYASQLFHMIDTRKRRQGSGCGALPSRGLRGLSEDQADFGEVFMVLHVPVFVVEVVLSLPAPM